MEYTKKHRIEILKGLDVNQRSFLFKDLNLMNGAVDSFLNIIENDIKSSQKDNEDKNKETSIRNE